MRTLSQTELKEILEKHKKWLNNEEGGKKANLSETNLSEAYLYGAYLSNANLSGANLSEAYLRGAYLYGANLSGANLYGADLSNADLSRANFYGADLSRANLYGADLSNADLIRAVNIPYIPMICPEEGSFIGYKKAIINHFAYYIVKLEIPKDAKRSSGTTRKCRCNKAKVLSITTLVGDETDIKEVVSSYDHNFVYRVNETVEVEDFDDNRWDDCSTGIHFFINRQEAVNYNYN